MAKQNHQVKPMFLSDLPVEHAGDDEFNLSRLRESFGKRFNKRVLRLILPFLARGAQGKPQC